MINVHFGKSTVETRVFQFCITLGSSAPLSPLSTSIFPSLFKNNNWMMSNAPFSSEILWLGKSPVSLVLGVSEGTLDLWGWSWDPRFELEGDQPRIWTAPGSILICYILCLASTHFLQGRPLPWKKYLQRFLSDWWAKTAVQPGVSIQGSWLVTPRSLGEKDVTNFKMLLTSTPPWPIPTGCGPFAG